MAEGHLPRSLDVLGVCSTFAIIQYMRSLFSVMLITTVLFAGGYFYNLAQAVCPIPIAYRIGELDDRFGLSLDEAKVAVAEAAEVWEVATGQNLFTYDDTADFTVNFVYDERQAFVSEEVAFSERLENAENINDALTTTYERLVSEYDTVKATLDRDTADFEVRLAAYNAAVAEQNDSGGAPPEVFAELNATRDALAAERARLNAAGEQLNALVDEINKLGEKGTQLIADYNETVGEFNERFGEAREFTQGDYRNDGRISIYTYKNERELQTVLAHEFGHALSLDHVAGEASVMYYLIGGQPAELTLSAEDLAEFNRVCGDMNLWDKIVYRLEGN